MELIPELLAPAGNAAAALAAFDAGADAVYAGLPRFNARERGENFTFDELARLAGYARANRRKLYVTMNTLVKETELEEAADYLARVAMFRPDAVIVQDLGLLRLAREYFPELELHASTQMGFHNAPGLAAAARLGIRRVILERQVNAEELRLIARDAPVDLEVFVHGALCCSLSGQCLFSSWLGGASGNRGKCKQPCRRRFYRPGGNGFFFSTGDLCLIEEVRELARLGIRSFKIEGRLRQPDYVRNAVRAYRMVLDAPDDRAAREVMGEARKLLSETCGRRWTKGYLRQETLPELIQHDNLGAAGMLVGKVAETAPNGFAFTARRRIHLGDRLRVQPNSGDEGPALTVTRLLADGKPARRIAVGELGFIFCDKPVAFNGLVFKLGASLTVDTARLDRVAAPAPELEIALGVTADGLTARLVNLPDAPEWRRGWHLAPAQRHGLDRDRITAEFNRKNCRVTQLDVPDAQLFLPAAELKAARQAFFSFIDAELSSCAAVPPAQEALRRFLADYARIRPAAAGATLETVALRPRGNLPGNPKARRAVSILDFNKTTDEAILPEFVAEERIPSLRKMIRAAWTAGIRRFRLTGLYALPLFDDYPEAELVAGFPLPVANSLAALELQRFKVIQVQAEPELERDALEALAAKSPLPVEVYRYGRLPLLVTRAEIPVEGRITDARDAAFLVRRDKRAGLTRLYAEKVLSLPRIRGTGDFYDLTAANWQEKESYDFNFAQTWL